MNVVFLKHNIARSRTNFINFPPQVLSSAPWRITSTLSRTSSSSGVTPCNFGNECLKINETLFYFPQTYSFLTQHQLRDKLSQGCPTSSHRLDIIYTLFYMRHLSAIVIIKLLRSNGTTCFKIKQHSICVYGFHVVIIIKNDYFLKQVIFVMRNFGSSTRQAYILSS